MKYQKIMLAFQRVVWYDVSTMQPRDQHMPSKPKPPGPPMLIQGLSQLDKPQAQLDDWGQPITVPMVRGPTMTVQEHEQAQAERKLSVSQAVLIAGGLGHHIGYRPPPIMHPPHQPGKRGVRITIAGEVRAMMIPMPSWRRV